MFSNNTDGDEWMSGP